jgi:hypothetical protein
MDSREAKSSGLLLAILLGVATALRVPGLATDFWLDEIWTLKIVLGMDSPWDVFTEVRHSNNHHLNTLFIWALGDLERWWIYRLPALAAGVGSVALAFWIGSRRSRSEGFAAGLLCATSYLLVHFSSEARGYSLVVFFGLASFALLQDFPQRRGAFRVGLFWVCAVLGFLSQLMYVHVFAAAGLWMALRLWRAGRLVPDLARLFAAPALFAACFYWFDVRLSKVGEGPELDALEVFRRALSYAVGGPPSGVPAALAAFAAVCLFAGAVFWWWRARRDEWLFLAVAVFASPALTFAAVEPEVFFVRYFLLSVAFGLVALAAPLAWAFERRGPWRIAALLLVAAVMAGNAVDLARFYRFGRGDYLGTLRAVSDAATARLPTVAGDHRFRTHTVIRFYNRYLPPDRRIVYLEQDEHPDWLLLHRIGELGPVDEALARDGERYVLERVARYSDLSGWHWLLYRRQ